MSQVDNRQREERKNQLLAKFERNSITHGEAEELRIYLEQEKEEASRQGNSALVFAIAILLGFVLKYLADEKVISFDKFIKFLLGKKRK